MSFTLYQASIPVFVRGLRNLSAFLAKAHADFEARKIDFSVLMAARLAPDMLPLPRQVQIACDMVKNGAGRLAGMDIPSFPDTEATYEELQARIEKTIGFVNAVTESQMEGAETRDITLKFPNGEMHFTGDSYLTMFVLPNLYFHITAAYVILRHNGAPLGKMDYMGGS